MSQDKTVDDVVVIGGVSVDVDGRDDANYIETSHGAVKIPDATPGFAAGAFHTVAGSATADDNGTYVNKGSATSSLFDKVDDEAEIVVKTVTLTNAEMLALRATPKTLVAAPGAGYFLEFISAVVLFDYTAAYTESADNMQVKIGDASGAAVSETIEATGLVDATADIMLPVKSAASALVTKANGENKALVLHNTGDGEYGGGNAANVVRVKVAYRRHKTSF
jgi:hypothetical protein